jgi:hypothetical protein
MMSVLENFTENTHHPFFLQYDVITTSAMCELLELKETTHCKPRTAHQRRGHRSFTIFAYVLNDFMTKTLLIRSVFSSTCFYYHKRYV